MLPPVLTDRATLIRNRTRATALFLQDIAVSEVQERLKEVNRTFTAPAVVTGFPQLWPGMTTVADDEMLSLTTQTHDLLIHAMALHWANDPVGQLVQCRRALQPDGWFMGLMFGGQTLHELRACLGQAESEVLSQELDIARLTTTLEAIDARRIDFVELTLPSPMSLPLMVERFREKLTTEKRNERLERMLRDMNAAIDDPSSERWPARRHRA